MTHLLYRALIVSCALTALAAAVFAVLYELRWATTLVALAVAQMPVLLHMQTRRMVRANSTVGSRVSRRVDGAAPAVLLSTARKIAKMQKKLEVLADAERASIQRDPATKESLDKIRRELRMTRLVMSEMLQAEVRPADPPVTSRRSPAGR